MYIIFHQWGLLLTSDFFSLIRSTQVSGDGGLKENPIYGGKEEVKDTSDTFAGGESQPLVSKEGSQEMPSIVVTSESAVGNDSQPLLSKETPQEEPGNDTFTGGESQPLVSKEGSQEMPSIVVTNESAVGNDSQPLLSKEGPQEKPDNVVPTEDLDDLDGSSSKLTMI